MTFVSMFPFVSSFILYLVTLFPGVAPYRDTGEMASVAATLGIAHPPGYPLYTLLSHLFSTLLPFGPIGFRLNVLSALAGAGTVWMINKIILALSRGDGRPGAGLQILPLVLATAYLQWYLSLVSEMYTINTFFAAWLVYLIVAPAPRIAARMYLLVFLFGLGLGNRMDLVMMAPLAAAAVWTHRRSFSARQYGAGLLFFLAGCSIFLYLPIRSQAGPILDWNHPATIERLWGTITRKTHGGTLDLVSATFAPGENFAVSMKFYGEHVLKGYAWLGLPLAVFGLYRWGKTAPLIAAGTFLSWAIAGPLFIYKANMPPNPHALAILEAHFLLPNLIVFLWLAVGVIAMEKRFSRFYPAVVLSLLMAAANLHANLPELCKRDNFIAYDYAKNILRSLPRNAVLVMKKDVQLFALWNQQMAQKRRPDVALVSQGLSGSPWYRDSWGRLYPSVILGPLHNVDEWRSWIGLNAGRPLFVSGDAEYPHPADIQETPAGLVTRVGAGLSVSPGPVLMNAVYALRGRYRIADYREFFTPDIIEDYAKASLAQGQYLVNRGVFADALPWFDLAARLQPLLPIADNYCGYAWMQAGDPARARVCYQRAATGFAAMHELSIRYRSVPAVQAGLLKDQSDALLSVGVCEERLGRHEQAVAAYQQALHCRPDNARAHFNTAVIYWKQGDWRRVVDALESAVRFDPDNQEAKGYLKMAREKMRR